MALLRRSRQNGASKESTLVHHSLGETHPAWVKSRHCTVIGPCPSYPRKRTSESRTVMSALGQLLTSRHLVKSFRQTRFFQTLVQALALRQIHRVVRDDALTETAQCKCRIECKTGFDFSSSINKPALVCKCNRLVEMR